MFKEASGLKLNYSKTQILQIGKREWNIKPLKLKNEKEKVYSLGTWFYKDPTVTVHENQVIKLEEFKKILKQWQHRNLTLHGRIMVLKSLALSKLNFLFSSMETTKDLVEECQKHVNSFIWKNKPPKLKSSVSMKDYADGGIKIPHIFSYVKASKAIWAKRMLHENDNWVQYIKTFLPNISLKHLLKCYFNSKDLPTELPIFYRQIFHAWFSLHNEPNSAIDVRRELIVLNKKILIDNEYIMNRQMIESNVLLINQLLDNEGKFLNYENFCTRYGGIVKHYDYISMIHAIPDKWKKLIRAQTIPSDICKLSENPIFVKGTCATDVQLIKSSDIYWKMINSFTDKPSCINAWSHRLNVNFGADEWKSVFTTYMQCTKDIKIRELQLQIVHRFYPCKSKISKWDPETKAECIYCRNKKANILHTFYECTVARAFWQTLNEWLKYNNLWSEDLTKENIILTVIPYKINTHAVNHMLLLAKYYINKETKAEKNISFPLFLTYYKHILFVEKEIYILNDNIKVFNALFGKMLNSL